MKNKFSGLKSALEETLESDEHQEERDIDQLKGAVTELHQVNEFLQEQVNIMTKEIK